MRVIIVYMCIALIGLAAPAFAQSRKELAGQNRVLSQRLGVLESRMLTGDPVAERLMQRVDTLEEVMRNLTGEVERLQYERDNLIAELEALQGDIREIKSQSWQNQDQEAQDRAYSKTIAGSQTGPQNAVPQSKSEASIRIVPSASAKQPSSIPTAPTLKEVQLPIQKDFARVAALPAQGKDKLSEGDFLGAQIIFREYLDLTPNAPDAGEVSFWLGETYFVRSDFADAASAYISSMRKAPNGDKAPEAMIRLGEATFKLGNKAQACQILQSFSAEYPKASVSVKAKARAQYVRIGC